MLSMGLPGKGNHERRAWSYTGVTSKTAQNFGASVLVTLDATPKHPLARDSCLPLLFAAGELCLRPDYI